VRVADLVDTLPGHLEAVQRSVLEIPRRDRQAVLPRGAAECGHVLVARGRDYADVPPLRGVYSGGRAEALDVQVEITRRA
jgi:hypothetical protein